MRVLTICLLSFATACAANSALAPSSMAVDPLTAVTLNERGNYEMTPAGVISLKRAEIAVDTRHAIELERCNGANRVCNLRANNAIKAADSNAWWSRNGPLLIVGGFTIGAGAGVGLTLGAENANRSR